jgi:hypothetical protein
MVRYADDSVYGFKSEWATKSFFAAVDGRVIEVQFDDWMYLMNDKVMLNKAAMRKWGVGLGEVTLSFFKR